MSVPAIDARAATLLGGVGVMPVPTLAAMVGHLRGEVPLRLAPEGEGPGGELADVRGQEHAGLQTQVETEGHPSTRRTTPAEVTEAKSEFPGAPASEA